MDHGIFEFLVACSAHEQALSELGANYGPQHVRVEVEDDLDRMAWGSPHARPGAGRLAGSRYRWAPSQAPLPWED